jgi:uncharacterized SAM-binding protein YcdF (DUF218 family)
MKSLLERVYDRLALGQPATQAELIFVLAGLPERKRYAWELYRRGLAPTLLLSVGRSEARFLKRRAGLPEDGDIVKLLPIRPERGNHLFLWFEPDGVRAEVVRLPELNTFGELVALATVLRRRALRHVVVVSSDFHLRRVRYAVGLLLDATRVQITYVGVPPALSVVRRQRWWSRGWDAWLVLGEWLKLAVYRVNYGMLQRHHRYSD